MVNSIDFNYSELLENKLILETDRKMELNRINILWEDFLTGKQKTIGVENIFPISLSISNKFRKRDSFLGIKTLFKDINSYASENFKNNSSKDKLTTFLKYSNEPSTIRIFSILGLISSLGGYKPNTWVSRKEIAISGHISPTSVNNLCEALYIEKFLEKYQDFKKGKTRGSISYKLNKKAKETLGITDSICNKIDREVWRDFKKFTKDRINCLYENGYIDKVKCTINYSDNSLEQEIVYTDKKIKDSRNIISILNDKLLKLEDII